MRCPPSDTLRRHGLRDIVRRVGVTTIIVTHDQEEAWVSASAGWLHEGHEGVARHG